MILEALDYGRHVCQMNVGPPTNERYMIRGTFFFNQ